MTPLYFWLLSFDLLGESLFCKQHLSPQTIGFRGVRILLARYSPPIQKLTPLYCFCTYSIGGKWGGGGVIVSQLVQAKVHFELISEIFISPAHLHNEGKWGGPCWCLLSVHIESGQLHLEQVIFSFIFMSLASMQVIKWFLILFGEF